MSYRKRVSVPIAATWVITWSLTVGLRCREATGQEQASEGRFGKPDAALMVVTGRVLDVTGEPASEASVILRHDLADINVTVETDKDGKFSVDIRLPDTATFGLKIIAHSGDESFMAFHHATSAGPQPGKDSIELQLEATKQASVRVTDAVGNPIDGANVALQLGYPNMLGPKLTDADGRIAFQLPENERIQSVVGWKDHQGLDYRLYSLPRGQESDKLTKTPEFPLESEEKLVLDGASPLTVRVTDAAGNPIAGSSASIWLLAKGASQEQLNLSYYLGCFADDANSDGEVIFNWFPSWQKGVTTVWPIADGFVHERGNYEPTIHNGRFEMQLERLVPLRGKVNLPDGKPAVGVAVRATGAGYTWDRFNGGTLTDENGEYKLDVAPNQIYMLYIESEQWSAPTQSGFAVLPGQAVADHDFVLSRATRLFGQVLNNSTGEPVADQLIYLTLHGIDLRSIGEDILPNPEKSSTWVCPMRQLNQRSDQDGAFEFFVGPGDYNLFIQGTDAEKFTVANEREMQVDLRIEVPETRLLTGLVINTETKEPLGGAVIDAVSRDFRRHNDWKASSNLEGKFQVERVGEATYLHATSHDKQLAAIMEISADETAVVLSLNPVGEATGRLLARDSSEPAAGVKLRFGVRIEDEDGQLSTSRFGQMVTTDAQGKFTLPNLVSGWEYECALEDHPNGYVLNVVKAQVESGESLDLGDVKMPEEPKPYVPPTLAERIQSAFSVAGTPLERFEKAKQLIADVNQNLLIVFGLPDDPLVHSLMKIRFEDTEFSPYGDDFRFMAIGTDTERLAAAQALAEDLGIELPEEPIRAHLVVVNSKGQVAAELKAAQFCDGEALSKLKLFDRLDQYKTTPLDAHVLLEDAFARAAKEDKRVLIQETATWCGPCHLLSRLLLSNRQWEKDYIWVKMDHRWTGAREIMQEIRDGAEGGIPWFAILDADGKKLATSNLPDSGQNIGFPSDATGQKHFVEMLTSTCQRMTAQEILDLASAASD